MAAVKAGAKAPKFRIPTTGGEFRLGDQGDENLVVYFYPRDNTPGCTLEGSDFRDLAPDVPARADADPRHLDRHARVPPSGSRTR